MIMEQEYKNKVATVEEEIKQLESKLIDAKRAEITNGDKSRKKEFSDAVKKIGIEITVQKRALEIAKDALVDFQLKKETEQRTNEKELQTEIDQLSIQLALSNMNAHYVINTKGWHCIYIDGIRHQPHVVELDHDQMLDHVWNDSGQWIGNPGKLKQIAKDVGRVHRDVERAFHKPKQHTFNQMTELKELWLKPVFGQPHHPAFDLLASNIAGDNDEYTAHLEKYVAYSYVRPEDIFAPNIDSSAKGGSGRDTFFRILEIIFTEECCGEAKTETVQGTHNGELFGKVWVKVSEQNNRKMNIEELKNLTGGANYRSRRMGENAIQRPRTFRFFMMSNNYEGTARLTGNGLQAEDRRWEPICSRTSLLSRIEDLCDGDSPTAKQMLQDWQNDIYQNETEIAKWLGNIIEKHGYKDYFEKGGTIDKLYPLHGVYYEEMVQRQKRGFESFMEVIEDLCENTNCFVLTKLWSIYKLVHLGGKTYSKDEFGKKVLKWLEDRHGEEFELGITEYYRDYNDIKEMRTRGPVIRVKKWPGGKLIFDMFDFIEPGMLDEKGKELGEKPHANNIKSELL